MSAREPNPDQRRTAARNKPSKPPEGGSPLGRLDAEALESQRAHERDLADRAARPVEDREPLWVAGYATGVGPYAPTRDGRTLNARYEDDPGLFEAGYRQGWRERHTEGEPRYSGLPKPSKAAECTIDHEAREDAAFNRGLDKGFGRGRQQGDADRAQRLNGVEMVSNDWAQDTAADHFRRGRKLGAAEREAELLDQGWTPPGAIVDLVSNGLHGNEAATEAGWEAAKMMGAETPYSVVGGIINAAIPHLSGAYIAAAPADRFYREPDVGLATDAEMNAPISDQARRNVIEALKAQDALAGPTEYEVWSDSISMATDWASMHGRDPELNEIPGFAFWFHGLLMAGYDGARADEEQTRVTEHEAAADLPAKEIPGAEADYPF